MLDLRLDDEHCKAHVSFVMGKSRVTLKNTISIPRLELAAATVSVKIGDVLKDQLEYENFEDHYWVVGGNSMVRQFISKCVTCRSPSRYRGRAEDG